MFENESQNVSKCMAQLLASIPQGLMEIEDHEKLENVVNSLQTQFVTNRILLPILNKTIKKGLKAIEIALVGPMIYKQTKVKNFAENFRIDVLLPLLKKLDIKEKEFIYQCLQDIKIIKEECLFQLHEKNLNSLIVEVACYVVQELNTFKALLEQANESFITLVREITSPPYIFAKLLEADNFISVASSIFCGVMLQNNEKLLRAYFLPNRENLKYQLKLLNYQIEEATQHRDRKLFSMLTKQKQLLNGIEDEFGFGLEKIQHEIAELFDENHNKSEYYFGEIGIHFRELVNIANPLILDFRNLQNSLLTIKGNGVSELEILTQDVENFKKQCSMNYKAELCDSLTIRTGEDETVKQFYQRFQRLRHAVNVEKMIKLQINMATLLSAIGKISEAEDLLLEAQNNSSEVNTKAIISYNRFVNFTIAGQFERANDEYIKALKYSNNKYQLFETHKYRPQQLLGAGGFGVVFLCLSKVWGPIVVKALLRHREEQVNSVIENAQALASSSSPYIIGLKDYGYLDWDKKQNPFIVMDYFSGENLSIFISNKGSFEVGRAIQIAKCIALGLQEAHKNGVIHRDLKPANILYSEDDEGFELKVIDFDLALHGPGLQELAHSVRTTGNKSVLGKSITGTIKYAPPEQMGEEVDGKVWEVDKYSDVFAFGRTLKYLLFGTLEPHPRILRKFEYESLLDLIGDCETKNPLGRPQNFDSIIEMLEQIEANSPNLFRSKTQLPPPEEDTFGFFHEETVTQISFPNKTNITIEEAFNNLPNTVKSSYTSDQLFIVSNTINSDEYAVDRIIEVEEPGTIRNGILEHKAQVIISIGEKSEEIIEFPNDKSNPFKELEVFEIEEDSLEEFFDISQEYDNNVPEGEVIQIIEKGIIVNNELQRKATIIVSQGKNEEEVADNDMAGESFYDVFQKESMQEELANEEVRATVLGEDSMQFPSKCGITIEDAKKEIKDKLSSEYMLDYAFKVEREDYSKDFEPNTISEINQKGLIKNNAIQHPAIIVLSKGINLGPSKIPGFTLIRETEFSCGNITNLVREFKHNDTGMKFILIPENEFSMGSPSTERGHKIDENLHKVRLSHFLIAKYPCFQKQWQSVMGNNPSSFKGDKKPVEQITWDDCQEFCKKTGLKLPTEAQWEYACRGGSRGAFYFGNQFSQLKEHAWYYENAEGSTHSGGMKKHNAFGLHDTLGNVWEYCLDSCDWQNRVITDTYLDGMQDPRCDDGGYKIIRGGAWYFSIQFCRCASRYVVSKLDRFFALGVRFAGEIPRLR